MNTTLRTLSAALAAALISPSVFAASATLSGIDFHGYMRAGVGSPATVVRPNGKKTKLAVWVMSPIPTASWSWDQRSIRRMT